MIDEAKKGTIFYRFVISPDPAREDRFKDLSLTDITIDTMIKLEERLGKQIQFVATLHDDHTNKRHTHVLALVKGRRLTREDFQALRLEVTEQALFQRQILDLTRPYQEQEVKRIRRQARSYSRSRPGRQHAAVPGYTRHHALTKDLTAPPKLFASYSCPICRYHEAQVITSRLFLNPCRCPYCGVKLQRDRENMPAQNLTQRKEAGLSLSLAP
jgi:hypothetical protein